MNAFAVRSLGFFLTVPTLWLAIPVDAAAQKVKCSALPRAEQAAARQQGTCVDDAVSPRVNRAAVAAPAVANPAAAAAANPAATSPLVRMPQLVGMTLAEASTILDRMQLRPQVQQQPTDDAPVGRVFAQAPSPGESVRRGSAVQLTVALAPVTLEVPNVVGLGIEAARKRLARFDVATDEETSVRQAGEVLRQRPEAGTRVRPGGRVSLNVSDGSLVQVPDVTKVSPTAARELLQQAQLGAEVVEADSSAAIGTVESQTPPGGSTVKRQSTIIVRVSKGLQVPNVVGRPVLQARTTLRSFTLRTQDIDSERPLGEVLSQVPAAGSHLVARGEISLSVSNGAIVLVPDVRDMTLADARAALIRAGDLRAAVAPEGDRPDAIVQGTTPPAGARIRRGSTLAVTLVPQRNVWPWIGGALALLSVAALSLQAMRRTHKSKGRVELLPQFSASLQRDTAPLQTTAGGTLPAVSLSAELRRGPLEVKQREGELL